MLSDPLESDALNLCREEVMGLWMRVNKLKLKRDQAEVLLRRPDSGLEGGKSPMLDGSVYSL